MRHDITTEHAPAVFGVTSIHQM